MTGDDELDRLYGVPLEEFVRERNRVAAWLRREGHGEEAEAVAALRKPALPVWALNQVARREPRVVRELARAAERLASAQRRGGAATFADAQRGFSTSVRRVGDEAARLLAEAGRRPGEAVLARVTRAAQTAAASSEHRDALAAGRLTAEPETSGFAVLGTVPARAARRAPRGGRRRPVADERRRTEESRRREERARLERELRDATSEATKARRAAERAERRVAELEAALTRLRRPAR